MRKLPRLPPSLPEGALDTPPKPLPVKPRRPSPKRRQLRPTPERVEESFRAVGAG